MVIASIVEEETNKDDEKGNVASVYYNRYKRHAAGSRSHSQVCPEGFYFKTDTAGTPSIRIALQHVPECRSSTRTDLHTFHQNH